MYVLVSSNIEPHFEAQIRTYKIHLDQFPMATTIQWDLNEHINWTDSKLYTKILNSITEMILTIDLIDYLD